MSVSVASALASAVPRPRGARTEGRWRLASAFAALAFACAWTLALGKDLHWDAVNYHLYLGYSALHDRFALDFFGAGTPSYLNPYAYVPLYLMHVTGVPAVAMAVVLAALHAPILWLTFELALAGAPHADRRSAVAVAVLAMVLAAANPVLLQWIGGTAIDLSTGVLVVGGWLALAFVLRDGTTRLLAVAGLLLGAAAALKLSNAIYAVAACGALVMLPGGWSVRLRGVALFGVSCGATFALVALPWSWQLWQSFRNPLFPFFNHWFASPDFTSEALRYQRFLPEGAFDYVARAFEMVAPRARIHTEPRAPDARYAALVVALLAWAIATLAGRRARGSATRGGASPTTAAIDGPTRVLAGLLIGVGVSWCLWLANSGNSRYFLPMACVASAALALLLQRLHGQWPNVVALGALALLGVQVVQIALGSDWRREGHAWEGAWMPTDVPTRHREVPHLYLSAHFLSGSALMPEVHPDAGIVSVSGFNVLGPGHPGASRVKALIDARPGAVRVMVPLPNGYQKGQAIPIPAAILQSHVARFGLAVDFADCDTMGIRGNLRGSIRVRADKAASPWTHFLTCRLVAMPEREREYADAVAAIDPVFDRVEDACPSLFHPRRPVTEFLPFPVRLYNMGSEAQLWVQDGTVRYFVPFLGGEPVVIGTVEAWMLAPQPIDCTRGYTMSRPAGRP